MHGNGGNAEFLARAQHAKGNFAAVGYEDFIEHASPSNSEWRVANSE